MPYAKKECSIQLGKIGSKSTLQGRLVEEVAVADGDVGVGHLGRLAPLHCAVVGLVVVEVNCSN